MRILLVTPYHAPAYFFGGPVHIGEVIVADLIAAGHEVAVATTDALDDQRRVPADTPPLPPGAEVLRFRNRSHALAVHARGWTPRGYVRWVRANVGRFDVVLLHDLYSVLSVAAARAAHRAGVPYVMQPLGSVAAVEERGKPGIKRAFLALWGRRSLREASAILHATSHEREDIIAAGGRPETLVDLPQPLDLHPATGAPLPAAPTVVCLGRLDPIKGIDRLIEAAAIARARVPDVRLEIVGPGDRHRPQLEAVAAGAGVADAVTFHGRVEDADKARALESAHLFALLSHSEGLPTAALEAMAYGTPVVLSRGCHFDEVDGRAGVVVDGDPAGAAAAIADLLLDPARRERLAVGAAELAQAFDRRRVMPRMIALFEELSAGGPR